MQPVRVRAITPSEFALRLRFLADNSRMSDAALSLRMKRPKGYVYYLTNMAAKNAPTRVDLEVAAIAANALAGLGNVVDDAGLIYDCLTRVEGDPKDAIQLVLVDPTGGPADIRSCSHIWPLTSLDARPALRELRLAG